MRDHDHGAITSAYVLDDVVDQPTGVCIEPRMRFVEQQELGFADERILKSVRKWAGA